MKIIQLFFQLVMVLSPVILAAQSGTYSLSSDSLVNFHASNKRVYYATRIEQKPKVDGRLDDLCWEQGTWSGGFVQQQPRQGQAPSQETEIKILFDSDNLYVAMRCWDNEPGKISPLLGRRDDFTTGDMAGIALDTYFDKRTAFEFNLSAAGQKIDLVHLGAYQWDTNWDAVWEGKTHVGDLLWTIEMRIPFSQLRFADKPEHVWGMHIWRWIDRLDEEDQWKLIPIDAPAMVYIFGELRGISGISPKRNFEVMPFAKVRYLSGTENKNWFGMGLDGKIGLSSNFTLDYTFNPDFGQVEADPSELNLTAYEVFYNEKRPFFLEGNAVLDYSIGGDMLFYSRRIGHAPSYSPYLEAGQTAQVPGNTSIISALKLTGKSKKGLSVGLVNSLTAREEATISSAETVFREAVEPFSNYSVGRLKQDLNNGNTVLGGMFTSVLRSIKDEQLAFLPDKSLVGGTDFLHNWKNRKYFVDLKSFWSHTTGSKAAISQLQLSSRHYFQRPDAAHLEFDPERTTLSGWGGELRGGKQSGKFRASGKLSWRSPGVELNDLGYLREADLISQEAEFTYQVNKPKGIFRNYSATALQRHQWSYGGENTGDLLRLDSKVKFTNLWQINLYAARYVNRVDTRQLRGGPSLRMDSFTNGELFVQTNSSRKVFVGTGYFRRWVDDGISGIDEYNFKIRWQVSDRFMLSSNTKYEVISDNSQYVTRKVTTAETKYLVGEIARKTLYTTLRAEFFVTPELSLQLYGSPYASTGQYRSFNKIADSGARDLSERFSPLTILSQEDGRLHLDEDRNGTPDFYISNPDFNFQEFRSNFVLRWEYKAGSTCYFVWSHNRSRYEQGYNPSILDSFRGISGVGPQNLFMLKFSYWFSL